MIDTLQQTNRLPREADDFDDMMTSCSHMRYSRPMSNSTSNIEAVARDICMKQLSLHGASGAALAADVDRYWHCVAAGLEAGLIDDMGDPSPSAGHEESLTAYHDWCRRHPESKGSV
jgi:hypothetical protein